jgi:hypothetical protein
MTLLALIGAKALYLLFLWLASAIIASYLSDRKGYGEKAGLASGLLLSIVGVVLWLAWPARRESRWKLVGPFGKGDGRSLAQLRAELHAKEGEGNA